MRWWPIIVCLLMLMSPHALAQNADTPQADAPVAAGTPADAASDPPHAASAVDAELAARGEGLFAQKGCSGCHSIGDGDRGTGPDLLSVTSRRERSWVMRWIQEPDRMLAEKDPTAMELLGRFNQIPMPNMGVSPAEAEALLAYIDKISADKGDAPTPQSGPADHTQTMSATPMVALIIFLTLTSLIFVIFARVVLSTRDSVAAIDIAAAYRIRKIFFFTAVSILGATLVLTLFGTPYPRTSQAPDHIVHVAAHQFAFTWSHDPVLKDADLKQAALIPSLEVRAGELVEFRVTSLDVTHDFAIYRADGSVLGQTQAMPGYVNRLLVRFDEPGHYNVFCLEYCGALHQAMRASFRVR